MAAPRLPFLWPILHRTSEIQALYSTARRIKIRPYSSSQPLRQQDTITKRYGTANEPPAHLGGGKSIGPPSQPSRNTVKSLPVIDDDLQKDGEIKVRESREREQKREPSTTDDETRTTSSQGGSKPTSTTKSVTREEKPETSKPPEDTALNSILESVAQPKPKKAGDKTTGESSSPTTEDEDHPLTRAPHLDMPRYVHHFDTYGLVRRLTEGGWSEKQAVTNMKAVRLMLTENMELAKDALVSKSMVENETYLFRAACAELKTEVTGRRRAEQDQMRTARAQLQHEVDILSQRMGQEAAAMKDELKGMFDDRKMAVRNEQRAMESKLQQLNYKITVSLQADAKSDVEGLRMVMTRRVIIALGVVVVMVLASLQLYSSSMHDQDAEPKKRGGKSRGGGTPVSLHGDPAMVALAGREMMVQEGDNPAFVSLG